MREESIFIEAMERDDPAERAAFLDQVCAGDEALRQRVERLLQRHEQADSLLDRTGPGQAVTEVEDRSEPLRLEIGPYRLLEAIGEGGMGTVYRAEQARPIRRSVAVKVIKAGMDSRQVLARFEVERQALALMDHPNIAKVLDAGTTQDGQPYFVMELVRGVPITRFCDERRMPLRERLELFLPVCQAVQHAHQKGIIHRDLKPSNVLVGLYDGVPVPKVIDFGVAKATGQKLTDASLFTGFGAVVGTPEYMSPEQAQLENLDVDTRADVYSLGVLLYELLTGSTPHDRRRLKQAGLLEILRVIREEEPPRPSARLSTTEELASVAATRGIEPRRLTGLVRGELDWIVMKALEKDRSRRYATANGLAGDLRRHLDDEPVQASPPSAWYRLRKFARRNRAALATATLVLVTLLVGTIVSVTQAIRATRSERLATANALRARRSVDDMYTQVAEKWLADQPRMQPLQREFLEKALRSYEEFAREVGTEPSVRLGTAQAYQRVGEIQHKLGDHPAATRALEAAVTRYRSLVGEYPDEPEYRHGLADALHKLGGVSADTEGNTPEREKLHREAVAIQEKLAADFPSVPEYRRGLAQGYLLAVETAENEWIWEEKLKAFRAVLAIRRRLVAEHPRVPEYRFELAQSYCSLSEPLRQLGHPREHRQMLRDAATMLEGLVAEFPSAVEYSADLANIHYDLARFLPPPEAEREIGKALAIQERLAADFPTVAYRQYDLLRSLQALGEMKSRAGKAPEAEIAFRRALEIGEKMPLGVPSGARMGEIWAALADVLRDEGRPTEAEAAYRRAVAIYDECVAKDPKHPNLMRLRTRYGFNLASFLATNGRWDEARDAYRKGLAATIGPNDATNLTERAWLLATYRDPRFHDPRLALELADRAAELEPGTRWIENVLGVAHYRAGHLSEAAQKLQKSMGSSNDGNSRAWFFLAMALWRLDRRVEARRGYDQAVAWMEENSPQSFDLLQFRAEAATLLGLSKTMPNGLEAFAEG